MPHSGLPRASPGVRGCGADVSPLLMVGAAAGGCIQNLAKVQGLVVPPLQLQRQLLSRSL